MKLGFRDYLKDVSKIRPESLEDISLKTQAKRLLKRDNADRKAKRNSKKNARRKQR